MATKLKLGTDNNWATKVDKLLAYNDENGNFKPIQFDADRDSTATRVNKAGLVENVERNRPRVQFDNNDGYLLLEPTRTNNASRSETPQDGSWADPLSEWTLLTETTTSPRGDQTRVFNLEDSTGTLIRCQDFSVAAGTYTISFYIKDIGGNFTGGVVDLGDVGSGDTTPSLSTVGSEWIRVSRTITITSTKNFLDIQLNFTGSTNKVGIWGLQLEAGSYATSYIQTTGTAAVTRTLDNAHLLNQTLFTNYPFTVYAKAKLDAIGNTIFSLNNTSSQNYYLAFYFPNSTQIGLLRRDLSLNDSDFYSFSGSVGTTYKIAVAFVSATAYKLYIDGTEIADITSGGSIPFNHDDISLGQFRITGDTGTRNSIDEFIIYNEALSDAELIALTS